MRRDTHAKSPTRKNQPLLRSRVTLVQHVITLVNIYASLSLSLTADQSPLGQISRRAKERENRNLKGAIASCSRASGAIAGLCVVIGGLVGEKHDRRYAFESQIPPRAYERERENVPTAGFYFLGACHRPLGLEHCDFCKAVDDNEAFREMILRSAR